MNDLIFIKENFNVVSASFMSYGQIQPKLYDWYLPFQDLDRIRLHTKALITVNGRKKKVFIARLSYHPKANLLYKPFPLIKASRVGKFNSLHNCWTIMELSIIGKETSRDLQPLKIGC